jgi:AcrR family transcriptional regulator
MRRNQQNSTESTAELGHEQTAVIMALMGGATVTDATKQANIDRTTFYLWLRSDAIFQAELNRAKQEQMDAMRAQLRGLADTAVSTVREMLTGTDVPAGVRLKAALAVLQGVGAQDPEPIGGVDPAKIESELQRQSFIDGMNPLNMLR